MTVDAAPETSPAPRRLPTVVNVTTAVLVIPSTVTLLFVTPALFAGDQAAVDVLMSALAVAVALAVLVLSFLARRGLRWAWIALAWLLIVDAVTGPVRLTVGYEPTSEDLWTGAVSMALTLIIVALLVAPRSARAYFRPRVPAPAARQA